MSNDRVVQSDRYVHVIYCDDIRFEAGNKRAYMGVYTTDLYVPSIPATLNRLCISVNLNTPVSRPFEQIHIKIEHGDKALMDMEVQKDSMKGQMESLSADPSARRINFQSDLFFSQLEITEPGKISVTVQTESEELKGNALKLRVASPAETSPLRFLCANMKVHANRDTSWLQLEMRTPEGQTIQADFHGQGIADLRDSIVGAVRAVPGLIEFGKYVRAADVTNLDQLHFDRVEELLAPPVPLENIAARIELVPAEAGAVLYGWTAEGKFIDVEVRGAHSDLKLPFGHSKIFIKYLPGLESIKITTLGYSMHPLMDQVLASGKWPPTALPG